MNKKYLFAGFGLIFSSALMLQPVIAGEPIPGSNSVVTKISRMVSRDNGQHNLYIMDTVPDQNCDLTDRAVLTETSSSHKAMYASALTAFLNSVNVVLRVEGCTDANQDGSPTAPKVTKVELRG